MTAVPPLEARNLTVTFGHGSDRDFPQRTGAARRYHDARPFGGQAERGRPPDTLASAGHERDLPL